MRRERLALALALGVADLAGAMSLEVLTAELSLFADRALDAAINDAILRRAPDADPQGFVAIALGKHGGEELNYSSDIDPIFLYDPDTLPRRARDEPGEAAQRVARQVCETLNAPTAEGYVFRVDLRLRPASEVSPPAISIDTAISHYESSALAWEQAAFIRSRAASGDLALGRGEQTVKAGWAARFKIAFPVEYARWLAGKPMEALALMAIGMTRLSMGPASIGPIKTMILSLHAEKVTTYVEELLKEGAKDVRMSLQQFAEREGVAIEG